MQTTSKQTRIFTVYLVFEFMLKRMRVSLNLCMTQFMKCIPSHTNLSQKKKTHTIRMKIYMVVKINSKRKFPQIWKWEMNRSIFVFVIVVTWRHIVFHREISNYVWFCDNQTYQGNGSCVFIANELKQNIKSTGFPAFSLLEYLWINVTQRTATNEREKTNYRKNAKIIRAYGYKMKWSWWLWRTIGFW